jgi:Domain of unknown function (DUF4376)
MPYVITNHNEQDFVILGPIEWKPRYIANVVSDETGEDVTINPGDDANVPFDLLPGVRIRHCNIVYSTLENFNDKIHKFDGPTWTYNEDGTATATWNQADKDLGIVKGEIKTVVASHRYSKEVSGVKLTLQGVEVSLDTSRENRDRYHTKHLSMAEEETANWKFSEAILSLSKADLLAVHNAVNAHVQQWFDWEANKISEIHACTDLSELDAVKLDAEPEKGTEE